MQPAPRHSRLEKFPKVVDGGGWKKGILRGTKNTAAITRWRHNPQDTYGTEECSQSGKASRSERPVGIGRVVASRSPADVAGGHRSGGQLLRGGAPGQREREGTA